jgi:hypothetical protein
MRTLYTLAALVGLAAFAGAAQADSLGRPCTDKPESDYLSLDTLKTKVIEQGYQIRSGEIRKACGEFYVLDKNDRRAELFVDPTSGKIIAGDGKGDVGMFGGEGKGNLSAMTGDADDQRDGDD